VTADPVAKRAQAGNSCAERQIARMRVVKRTLDPGNVLDPGKVF